MCVTRNNTNTCRTRVLAGGRSCPASVAGRPHSAGCTVALTRYTDWVLRLQFLFFFVFRFHVLSSSVERLSRREKSKLYITVVGGVVGRAGGGGEGRLWGYGVGILGKQF